MSNDAPSVLPTGRRILFARASYDHGRLIPCQFCKGLTSRCLAFKLEGDPAYEFLPSCDPCFDFVRHLPDPLKGKRE
jgi:hypothetical protein